MRAKYAVLSMAALASGVSDRAFLPLHWARFCQPCVLAYAADPETRERIAAALAAAAATMASATLPLMPRRFAPAALWQRAFSETYRTEFRSERAAGRADQLLAADIGRYRAIALSLVRSGRLRRCRLVGEDEIEHAPHALDRLAASTQWFGRRLLGKAVQVLRLAKASVTFEGGLDYILWKIERHSGVKTEPTDWQRRHPLIAAPSLAWRLFRRGAFR